MTTAAESQDISHDQKWGGIARLAIISSVWILILTGSAILFRVGLSVRHWSWTEAEHLHFENDVTRGYHWGTRAHDEGLFHLYKNIRDDYGDDPPMDVGLDYAPLRLTIVTVWAGWVNHHFDEADEWDPDKSYEFHRPMIQTNAAFEAATAVGVALVIYQMWKTAGRAVDWRMYTLLAIAALLVWFNPALILNDVWPQWDVWILPSFVFGLYFSMRGWHFWTGILIGIGAMLKGQILIIAPIFVLWPLFTGQWLGAIRVLAGLALSFTLISVPWMLQSKGDWLVASSGIIVAAFALIFRRGWRKPLFQLIAIAALVVPIWLTPRFVTGDISWLVLPFEYGATKHPDLAADGTSNLAAILQQKWGWEADGPDGMVHIPLPRGPGVDINMRQLLGVIFYTTLLACSIAAAIQWRRKDVRFLMAVYAPWVLFFALMPHMNNRYLVWAGGLFPLLIPMGLGMSLLGALVCAASCAVELERMCRVNPESDPTLQTITVGLYPDIAFLILLLAAIFLFQALVISPRPTPPRQI